MRAVVLEQQFGGPEVLRLREVPDLLPGPCQVRVKVAATGINRTDIREREGHYGQRAPEPGQIPGVEFAGTIDALGPGIASWQIGDRVFGLLAGGGYAEQVVTHEHMLVPVPDGMSSEEAAAIPEVFFTAYDALVYRAGLTLGDISLIHAGGSGVGTAATQLAKAMGATVFVTVGNEEKARRALRIGADRAIVHANQSFDEVILAETKGHGADVILDCVGGPYLNRNLTTAAAMGRIVLLGLLGGVKAEIDITPFFGKRLTVVGTTLRRRPIEQKIALTESFIAKLLPLFVAGRIRPVIDRVFALEQIAEAHRYMEENRNFGKIVVRVA